MIDEMEVKITQKRVYIPRNRAKRVMQYPAFKFIVEEKFLLCFLLLHMKGNNKLRPAVTCLRVHD